MAACISRLELINEQCLAKIQLSRFYSFWTLTSYTWAKRIKLKKGFKMQKAKNTIKLLAIAAIKFTKGVLK